MIMITLNALLARLYPWIVFPLVLIADCFRVGFVSIIFVQ